MKNQKRSTFSGSLGFILSAASSAIGLGNIWRFPYLAAKYGGGIFLLIYVILVVTFGYSLMLTENALGRKTQSGPLEAFSKLNKKWLPLGIISFVIPVIILAYYNIIGGWVVRYAVGYIAGDNMAMAEDGYFSNMLSNTPSLILFQTIFTIMTSFIVFKGVEKGIERFSKILMPMLFILAIIISVYSITLPGAMEGVKYLFVPDFGRFSLQGVLAAMGQMFYSLSLAMGIMITYGSYIPKNSDLEKNVSRIEIFDTAIAVLAGLMIIPAVFAFSGGDESALSAGPGLMFITLPKVFASMGGSRLIGLLFFILVLFAALTSSISIMETIVATLCDKLHWSRPKASIVTAVFDFLLGIPAVLGYSVLSGVKIFNFNILDFMDFITNSVLMPIAALFTCIFVGYVIGVKAIKDEVLLSGEFKREKIYTFMIKYAAPIFTVAILVSSVLDSLGIIKM